MEEEKRGGKRERRCEETRQERSIYRYVLTVSAIQQAVLLSLEATDGA